MGNLGIFLMMKLTVGQQRIGSWPELYAEYEGERYFKYCRTAVPRFLREKLRDSDPAGFVPQKGQSGYFASVEADKPCPKD